MEKLRRLLAAPSDASWRALGELLPTLDPSALRDRVIPEAEAALRAWPDEVWRVAPASWQPLAAAAPLYRLTRPLALELVPIDPVAWEAARAATAAASDPFAQAPAALAGWRDLLTVTDAASLRACALALRHYLETGLGIAPTVWRLEGAQLVRAIVHHGELRVAGSLTFQRYQGDPGACLVTGDVDVSDGVYGTAFAGELLVGGSLACARLERDAELAVGGDITCRYARLCWYDCSWAARSLTADVVVDHQMGTHGEGEARLHLRCADHDTSLDAEHRELLEGALLPELAAAICDGLDEDDGGAGGAAYARLDELIGARLARGEPVFRA